MACPVWFGRGGHQWWACHPSERRFVKHLDLDVHFAAGVCDRQEFIVQLVRASESGLAREDVELGSSEADRQIGSISSGLSICRIGVSANDFSAAKRSLSLVVSPSAVASLRCTGSWSARSQSVVLYGVGDRLDVTLIRSLRSSL